MTATLEGFIRWCHTQNLTSQMDACVQIAQLELLRRNRGVSPEVVALPEPRTPRDLPASVCLELVAHWEATSVAAGLSDLGDDSETDMLLRASAIELTTYLAALDGVPIRLERLDPIAFASALGSRPPSQNLPAPPHGYESVILHGVATIYERAARRGFIEADRAAMLVADLDSLALTFVPSRQPALAS